MNFSSRSILLLFGALLCFTLGWHLQRRTHLVQPSNDQAVPPVEAKIDSVLARQNRDIALLERELLSGNRDFQTLLNLTQYPAFVYESDTLVFWSHHTLVSGFDGLHQLKSEQMLETRFGKFLVQKRGVLPDFVVISFTPLELNYGISNRYLVSGLNTEIFGDLKAKLVSDLSEVLPEVYSPRGNYLFSMLVSELPVEKQQSTLIMLLFGVGLLFAIGFLIVVRKEQVRTGYEVRGIIFFMAGLLLLRAILLYFNFPFYLSRLELFNPKYYAATFWSPSIGDLLLNSLLLFLAAYQLLVLFRRRRWHLDLLKLPPDQQVLVKLGCLAVFYFFLYYLYHLYSSVYTNSLLVLDITQSLQFDEYKLSLLAAFLVHTAAFLALSYLAMSVFFSLQRFHFRQSIILVVVLGLAFTIINWLELEATIMVFLALVFTSIMLVWEVRPIRSLYPYQQYLFGFVIIGISAATGSIALYHHYHEVLQVHKQKFAKVLSQENDVLGEYLLENVAFEIALDPLLKKKLTAPIPDAAFIKQKVQRYYLRDHFEKYETDVKIYDAAGNLLNARDSTLTLAGLVQELEKKGRLTSQPDLFMVTSPNDVRSRKYVKLIRIPVADKLNATVVLELNLKKLTPHSVVPELLVDQKFAQPLQSKSVSYAVYKEFELLFSDGDFDYDNLFEPDWLRLERLYTTGRTINQHDHFAVAQPEGGALVVTTVKYLPQDIWSNFSFLFLLHVVAFLVVALLFAFMRGKFQESFRTSFSTKIQLFLNFGILVPLLLISIAIGSLVTSSYRKDLTETYSQRGRLIQENLVDAFTNGSDFDNKTWLDNTLANFSKLSETDINFYDASGRLQASSQPLIFEAGLLSRLINPQAYASLAEKRQKHILLAEKAGTLDFSSLYLPIYKEGSRQLLGFISLPFFDSEKELNLKLNQLITTILNIFTLMFIGFMALTFAATRVLTVPLKLLTEKLKKTTLTGQNERLTYDSKDEIGILVQEYNQMIEKLEESRTELALREKEAAWREMARQVAHEIKNPLTPMKLSLQYLQKAIAEKRDNVEELISKISRTLITNIDILSDIATSFSTFTALPELKPERINLATVLKKSVDLNFDPVTASFELAIEDPEATVVADENLMMRTFNNLFLNALQAIPAGRKPFIQVSLKAQPGHKVLISIKDNGSGIPEDVQEKVFIPNFSTKYTGSGIGLAVAKKGIESAGGHIWFETEEDQGTT
ncbi:MAG TPA: HAMP domain-containing sensor histidine kinase, partial [Adhaeribacter sp.]|nr:HAMP domain-containing sensor histidine kinase [Adhaeribacter sp.]